MGECRCVIILTVIAMSLLRAMKRVQRWAIACLPVTSSMKCIAADVHDWAMQSQAKPRKNVTLSASAMLHGVGNCRGVDNGVMLKPSWIKGKHRFSCHCNYCSWLSTIRFGSLEFL